MGKKKRKEKLKPIYTSSYEDRVFKALVNLKHRDLQKECIRRGMPFEEISGSHHKLVSFFYKNFERTQNESLLVEYDIYLEGILEKKGYKKGDALLSPALRFSYNGNIEQMNNPKDIKPKNLVPNKDKKPKSEVDTTTGVRKGTKKAMTFDLAYAKVDLDEVVTKVTAVFPDAQEKSIRIWYKKALKKQKAG